MDRPYRWALAAIVAAVASRAIVALVGIARDKAEARLARAQAERTRRLAALDDARMKLENTQTPASAARSNQLGPRRRLSVLNRLRPNVGVRW